MFSSTLIQRLAEARRVAVLTGAGISAESGVPTFRDADGLWQRFRPEELANVEAFLQNPALVQSWYGHRRSILREVEPNPGHHALADLERILTRRGDGEFALLTQNVDNLHQRAGSERVVELHGNITRNYCMDCGREADGLDDQAEDAHRCPACGGLIRPDVVWFGEYLPPEAMQQASAAAEAADVFLSVGTSSVVYPAAGLPLVAVESGAYVVEVNIERSAIAGRLSEVLEGPAGEVLPALVATVRDAQGSTG